MKAMKLRKTHRMKLSFLCALGFALLAPYNLMADSGSTSETDYWSLNGLADGARVLRDGAPFWQYAGGNDRIRAGSDVEIPGKGGLIRSEIGAVTALKTSRFWVPSDDAGQYLEQVQGSVRYHINRSLKKPFEIETPELSLATSGSVFEIRVGALGTEVDLIEGAAGVATKDGISEARLDAGQSARVSSENPEKLEIRRHSGANFVVAGLRR